MHNSYPQLGFFHKGLNTYIYNDDQMGNALTDLWGSITGGVSQAASSVENKVKDDINSAGGTIKNSVISNFLDTGTGQAVVADAKQSWLEQQTTKVKTVYLQNKTAINTTLLAVGGLAVLFMLMKARSSGYKAATRSTPGIVPIPFNQGAPVQAGANPRRKRKHKRHYRKHR